MEFDAHHKQNRVFTDSKTLRKYEKFISEKTILLRFRFISYEFLRSRKQDTHRP